MADIRATGMDKRLCNSQGVFNPVQGINEQINEVLQSQIQIHTHTHTHTHAQFLATKKMLPSWKVGRWKVP